MDPYGGQRLDGRRQSGKEMKSSCTQGQWTKHTPYFCLSVCLSVCSSSCLFLCLSLCSSSCLSVCLSLCSSSCLFLCLSVRLSVCRCLVPSSSVGLYLRSCCRLTSLLLWTAAPTWAWTLELRPSRCSSLYLSDLVGGKEGRYTHMLKQWCQWWKLQSTFTLLLYSHWTLLTSSSSIPSSPTLVRSRCSSTCWSVSAQIWPRISMWTRTEPAAVRSLDHRGRWWGAAGQSCGGSWEELRSAWVGVSAPPVSLSPRTCLSSVTFLVLQQHNASLWTCLSSVKLFLRGRGKQGYIPCL